MEIKRCCFILNISMKLGCNNMLILIILLCVPSVLALEDESISSNSTKFFNSTAANFQQVSYEKGTSTLQGLSSGKYTSVDTDTTYRASTTQNKDTTTTIAIATDVTNDVRTSIESAHSAISGRKSVTGESTSHKPSSISVSSSRNEVMGTNDHTLAVTFAVCFCLLLTANLLYLAFWLRRNWDRCKCSKVSNTNTTSKSYNFEQKGGETQLEVEPV